MGSELDKIKQQHINNYRSGIIEIIKNNTNVLVDEDITSLLKKPPLDSMDIIKSKFLSLAKRNKIIFNIDELNMMLDSYREFMLGVRDDIRSIRFDSLSSKVEGFTFDKIDDVIKINKKDFNDINKSIRRCVKERLLDGYNNYIMNNIDRIFMDDVSSDIKNKIIMDISKWMKRGYRSELMESIDFKILVKDTTLINSTREQGERYLFTLNNSRLFDE